jgi:CheY-like chemotaxis protein
MPFNTLNGLTIVVVEDHEDARRYLALFLSRSGANVVVARDAFEGLEAIKKNRPHLVISDIQMPGKDGVNLLREIRALGPDHESSVPVIAMTGIVSPTERTRLLNAGFQAYLPKPFGPDRLLETILTVLKK